MKNEQETIKNLYHIENNCCLPACGNCFNNMQNAIANILYAQAEQIKKIISLTEDISCMTDINDVVNKNIYELTIFENSVYDNFKLCCPLKKIPLKPICDCNVDGGTF